MTDTFTPTRAFFHFGRSSTSWTNNWWTASAGGFPSALRLDATRRNAGSQ